MKILARTVYGSFLYGTNIPTSDNDIRAIYLPTIESCVLQTISKAMEIPEEDDTTIISFQHYMKMLREGQNLAIEILCTPDDKLLVSSPEFESLRQNRQKFFSKNMTAFCSFARNMVSKYSVRIERMRETDEALATVELFLSKEGYFRLGDIWDELPEGEFLIKTINERQNITDQRVYSVCGRQLQATVPLGVARDMLINLKNAYGARVRASEQNQFDYKAVMHAFRAIYQVMEIVKTKDLKFPLANAEWLRDVRLGKYHFVNDGLQDKLDQLLIEAELDVAESDLPDMISSNDIEKVILSAYSLA